MLLSRGQNEGYRLAPALYSYMDFRAKAAPGAAQRLVFAPLLAPAAC